MGGEARATIETSPTGSWVLKDGTHEVATFASFEAAAARAVEDFGVGSYLVRISGATTVTVPASVLLGQAG